MISIILFCLFLIPISGYAADRILITYFNPFAGSKTNNSSNVARETQLFLNKISPETVVTLCELETKYQVAAEQAKTCIDTIGKNNLTMVLSLGEGGTGLDLEFKTHNINYSSKYLKDNASIYYEEKSSIIDGAASELSLNYPMALMYCAIPTEKRKYVNISDDPGTFVCNNTAYLLESYLFPETPYAFIHVPTAEMVRYLSEGTSTISDKSVGLDYRMRLAGKGIREFKKMFKKLGRLPNAQIDNSFLGEVIGVMVISYIAYRAELDRDSRYNRGFEMPIEFSNIPLYKNTLLGDDILASFAEESCLEELASKMEAALLDTDYHSY